jgi:subtilisin family serine protease
LGDDAGDVGAVAVVDTGIQRDHPAFAGMTIVGEANVLSEDGTVGDVGDGQDNDRDGLTDEMTGHGTHVAGIVAQVAPDARLMPIKALDSDGVGDTFLLAKAIYHAVDNGADVINLSLGTTADPADTIVVQDAVKEAIEIRKLVVVAAAGNENRLEPQEYPATGGKAIGVASTDQSDAKSDFSNYHGDLDLSAPGTDIVSAYPGNAYVAWSGTSMATPWVSGAAALLLEDNASWDPDTVTNRLRDTAAPITEPSNAVYGGKMGKGRLNVAAAVGCG